MSDDDFLRVEASDCPMSSCAAPAGSPCRTGRGRVAAQYHTARFRLVPHLAKALSVPVPPSASRARPGPSCPGCGGRDEPAGHVRIGYARASTVRQSLDTQVDSLQRGGRHPDLLRKRNGSVRRFKALDFKALDLAGVSDAAVARRCTVRAWR